LRAEVLDLGLGIAQRLMKGGKLTVGGQVGFQGAPEVLERVEARALLG
jgi:hypothetical protein